MPGITPETKRDKSEVRRRNHEYYLVKREHILEKAAEYRATNREAVNESIRVTKKKYPERYKTIDANMRALRKNAVGSHTAAEWEAIKRKQNGKCSVCGDKSKLTRDHIVPLSKGGTNYAFNLQGLCQPCNSKKHATITTGLQHSLFDGWFYGSNRNPTAALIPTEG